MENSIGQKEIGKIIKKLFQVIGVPKKIFTSVVEGLIETSLRGVDSHGIRLAPHYLRAAMLGRINKSPEFKFEKTSLTTLLMDADHTFGITAGKEAMGKAIGMAKENGTGIVVVKNSSHFGAAGIYGLMAAREKMIGISMTDVEDLVVPYGGTKPFLGTNAFCFTAPMKGEEPFILDMATSGISFNKLRMHKEKNQPLELGWAVDEAGESVNDPNKAAALTHFGGYKGYGIALMVEILTGILANSPYGPHLTHMFPLNEQKRRLNHFFLALDIKKFLPVEMFEESLKQMADEIRNQRPAKGFEQVMVAGDPEKSIYQKRIKNGIPLTEEILKSYEELAGELEIKIKWDSR